ncbi:MAG: glycosyltransferase family 2 protein [Acidobacteriota bacterium]|nr:glycosyltransferase family 2 protein [Acidobacteriota bacterium]
MIAEIVFGVFVILILYTFLGYPLAVFWLSRLFPRPIRKDDFSPSISIIIAAYNEERDLKAKLDNMLSLDYPKEKLEIVVASDCSSDDTDEIVRSYADRGVILHRQEVRQGKTRAQQQAVKISTGEILVFSDATTIFELDALKKIVRSFADPEVGCVAGQLVYVDRTSTAVGKGCRSYWGYEKFLKACESRLGSLIGVSGCLYAVRRICQARLANQLIDDFVIATEIHLQGLRTVYEPEAISTEDTNNKGQDELRMRVRVISQTLRALNRYREIFSLTKHGMFAFQMFSHKVLRYVVPVFLIGALISNWFLLEQSPYYKYAFLAQAVFYFSTVVGWGAERMKVKIGPLAIPYYFLLVNVASVAGFLRFIGGGTQVVWEPIRESRISTVATDSLAKPQLAGKGT